MPNNQLKDTFQFPFKKRILTRRSTWTLIRRYRARPQPIATVRNNTHDHCPQESSTRFHPRPEISRPQKTLDRRACTNCRSSLSLSLLYQTVEIPSRRRGSLDSANSARVWPRGTSTSRWQPSLDNPSVRSRSTLPPPLLSSVAWLSNLTPHNAALISYGVPAVTLTRVDSRRTKEAGNEIWKQVAARRGEFRDSRIDERFNNERNDSRSF